MTKFKALFKMLYTQQHRKKPMGEKKSKIGTVLFWLLIGICCLPVAVGVVVLMYFLGTFAGEYVTEVVFLLFLLAQGMVLIVGVPNVMSNVFMSKDGERLLCLPVRASTIFTVKFSLFYLEELITSAVMTVLALVPFGIGGGFGVSYYLLLVVAIVLLPLLPMVLATVIAMPITALMSNVKGSTKTLLQSLLYVVFIALYFWLVYSLGYNAGAYFEDVSGLEQLVVNFADRVRSFEPYIHPNFVLAKLVLSSSLLDGITNFGLVILEHGALLFIAVGISALFYNKMISHSVEGASSSGKKRAVDYSIKQKGVLRQLISIDFKRVMRDPQMGFQSLGGLIVVPLVAIVFSFSFNAEDEFGETVLSAMLSTPEASVIFTLALMLYMLLLCTSTNVLGIYPISRENKSLYMLKTFPISFGKILSAKVILATIINALTCLVTVVLCVLLLGVKWYFGLPMFLCLVLCSFGAMCINSELDLKKPKLGWVNFNQSLKNASNTWFAMLVSLICMLVVGATSALFIVLYVRRPQNIWLVLLWSTVIIECGLFAYFAYKNLLKNSSKLFERIDA